MKKIKYVPLEANAFLADMDFQVMTAEQRGVYYTLILYLYCNNGKCDFDADKLKKLCNCKNFEKVWEKISKKFQKKNGYLKHKRVTKELRKAKKFLQHQRTAGLKGAKKRWAGHGDPNGGVIANESKRNVIEETKSKNIRIRKDIQTQKDAFGVPAPISKLQSLVSSNSLRTGPTIAQQLLSFNETLREVIRPRNQSDRTAFRNIGNWLMIGIGAGQFNEGIFKRVLEYAGEAAKGKSRNPAAVFISILKRELGYKK